MSKTVHIISPDPHGDRILDRLARTLAEGTGWSLSNQPDTTADINYFIIYIDYAQRFSDWRRTTIAAYFSHYEADTPYKRFWWESAAPLVDIKTTMARQYAEMLPGNVHMVTPPVDIDRFVIDDHRTSPHPLIGVSGFVDRSGRKGEKLVARLAAEMDGKAEIVASGDGWPARIINRSLDGLNHFYNSIDAYLCASTVEGVPMPPLEALSCGVPIIIPRGVGMLDDLPDMRGIYRYEAGNYDAMQAATNKALAERKRIKRDALRAVVTETYTPAAWCNSHVAAFDATSDAPAQPITPRIESDRHGKRGVYYVAYGGPARECAKGAIASFKANFYDIPVALVSDTPLDAGEDIFIQHPDEDIGGRSAKVKIYDLAPADWQYIVYLDADTEITQGNPFLWQILEAGWDMCICKNPGRFHIAREMKRSDNGDECDATFRQIGTDEVIQLNGGVFGFQRNDRTRAFFDAWHNEWRKWGKRDQAALLRALWANPMKMFVLGNEWNTITRYDSEKIAAWLLHWPMTARRWRGVVHYRLDDPQAWKAVEEFERTKSK